MILNNGEKDVTFYSIDELAEILHVTRRTIIRWDKEEKIKLVTIGNKKYLSQDALNEYLGVK